MRVLALVAVVTLAGCAYTPPPTPTERPMVPVSASFGKTWDAVIDVFASRNIPIKTLDRSSGLIVAEESTVPLGDPSHPSEFASCGKTKTRLLQTHYYQPTRANYNILVRGDSSASRTRVTVAWFSSENTANPECTTNGTFEGVLEQRIKTRAEGSKVSE